jgi:WD40 repeat protein
LADSFFIGSVGKFMLWSVSQEKVNKDYGHIITDDIYSMVLTSDKNYLFVSNLSGF